MDGDTIKTEVIGANSAEIEYLLNESKISNPDIRCNPSSSLKPLGMAQFRVLNPLQ